MTRVAAAEIDFFDQGFLANPHDVLTGIRDKQPVFFHEELAMWVVSRHSDIRAVLLDHTTFRPDNALNAYAPLQFPAKRILAKSGFRLPPTLANNGDANHLELRRVAMRFIGPSQLERATPLIIEAATSAIDDALHELHNDEAVDLVEAVARPVPSRVILALLGFDGLAIDVFTNWSSAALELFWGRPPEARQQHLATQVAGFYAWLEEQLISRKDGDGTMMSALLQVRDRNGRKLSRNEIIGACFFTLIAGQETTGQLLASSFHHLLLERARWSSLRDDPSASYGWIEEIIRREPPISTWRRVTNAATKIGDVDLPKNAQVLLVMTSAGSDPELFTGAEELCPHRANQRDHLAFGLGKHRCPGAELARAEAGITLRMAVERLPPLQLLHSEPAMLDLLSFRSPTQVMVARA